MLSSLSLPLYRLIVSLGVLVLLIPKINLINFAGESAGIRIDDLVLFFIFSVLFIGNLIKKNKFCTIEYYFFAALIIFISSNLFNILFYDRSTIAYSFRILEYFIFFYIGYFFQKKYCIANLVWFILISNAIIMLLQSMGFVGGFSSGGFIETTSDRVIGLTGGPWEIGALINIFFAILVLDENDRLSKLQITVVFIFTFSLILLTGARMPAIAHLALLMITLYFRAKNKKVFILSFLVFIKIFIAFFYFIPNSIADRSENLFSMKNIDEFIKVLNAVPVESNFQGFPDIELVDATDLSWLMRVSKWTYAIKQWFGQSSFLLGVGPGTWGVALDGGWLRVITETGILGTIAFLALFRTISRLNLKMFGIVISLFINMIMIDVNLAYKVMSFIFFSSGYFYSRKIEFNPA